MAAGAGRIDPINVREGDYPNFKIHEAVSKLAMQIAAGAGESMMLDLTAGVAFMLTAEARIM